MAILTAPQNNDYLPPAPAGTFAAICTDIVDQIGVQRRKYQSEEMETVNLTTFTFSFTDGGVHQIRTKPMLISAHEKSALFKFLSAWLGRPPKLGWDYCELKGFPAMISVSHAPRQNGEGVFSNISSIMPLPKGMPMPVIEAEVADEAIYDQNGDVAFAAEEQVAPPPPAPKLPPRAPAAAPKPAAPKAPAKPQAPAARRPAAPPPAAHVAVETDETPF